MAVGTVRSDTILICSAKPSKILSQTDWVASGVTSLVVGPVPPVVKIRLQPRVSLISIRVFSITGCSSSIILETTSYGLVTAFEIHSCIAGPLISS